MSQSLPPTLRAKPLDATSRRRSVDPVDFSNDFTFKKTLGEGSFGKVKLAVNNLTGEKVAVKVMKKKNMKKVKDLVRAEREIKVLTLVDHPNIAKLHKVITTEEHIYMVLEYAPGGELFDYIVARGRVKEDQARAFFREILSAVCYCHTNFFIHRDLKPENLLLDNDLHIKIIDFGFANTFNVDELLETFCGSPAYAAPEMLKAEKYAGPKVDIWAMGVILYALVVGQLPFDAPNVSDLYKKAMRGAYQVPFYVSPECTGLLQRMLVVDPARRADIIEVMNHRWVTQGYGGPPDSHLPQRDPVDEVDSRLLHELATMGFNEDEVAHAVLNNEPVVANAAYHLLMEKKMRELSYSGVLEHRLRDSRTRRSDGFLPPLKEESLHALPPLDPADLRPDLERTPPPPASRTPSRTTPPSSAPGSPARTSVSPGGPPAVLPPLPAVGEHRVPQQRPKRRHQSASPNEVPDVTFLPPGAEAARRRQAAENAAHAAALVETLGGASAAEAGPLSATSPVPAGEPVKEKESLRRRFSAGAARAINKVLGRREELPPTASSPPGAMTPEGVRVSKGPFSVATTSSKPLGDIVSEIQRACETMGLEFARCGYVFECGVMTDDGHEVQFDIEICAVDRLNQLGMHGIKIKRIHGDTWAFKQQCHTFFGLLRL